MDNPPEKGLTPSFLNLFIYNWLITDPQLHLHNNKNYQALNHENMPTIFFCGGRLKSIKGRPIVLVTGIFLTLPAVLFWIYLAQWIWFTILPAPVIIFSYCWLLTFSFYLKAATTDPGVLPRNLHIPIRIDPITKKFKSPAPEEYFNMVSLPYSRRGPVKTSTSKAKENRKSMEMEIENATLNQHHHSDERDSVVVKYCITCHIWRSARDSHCNECNTCVLNHDHHCIFLNNCIGYRNYHYFLWFLAMSVITGTQLVIYSFLQVFHYRFQPSEIKRFEESITKHSATFFLCIYTLLILVYPLLLFGLHLFLTSQNMTTREYLNNVWGKKRSNWKNVFNTNNIINNLYINWFGKGRGYSLLRMADQYELGDIRMERISKLEGDF